MPKIPEKIKLENSRFYTITQTAYFAGALSHCGLGLFFWWLKIYEMVWFNFILSVPIFIISLVLNRQGRHGPAFSLAFFELLFHQIAGVYFLGWDSGFQYVLIYLAGLTFFNARWSYILRIFLILVVSSSFILLFLFFKSTGVYQLSAFYIDLFLLSNSLTAMLGLATLINHYVRAADKAEGELIGANDNLSQKNAQIKETLMERDQAFSRLETERQRSEEMAALLKKMFGRYLSTEVMNTLIEDPSTLEMGGEKRNVTIMMTDLRGFTALCERLKPEQVVQMLNNYFELMVDVIDQHQGTISSFIGDAVLVIFGAPQEMPDRSQRAIACAIDMQNTMAEVNRRNRSRGLAELEMGIGLNESEVIVGNIGSSKRSQYTVIGSGVNMASRIESYTVGGQILVSESVYRKAGTILRIDAQRDIFPKGSETPLRIYEVGGIAGPYNIALKDDLPAQVTLSQKIPLQYSVLEKKDAGEKMFKAFITGLSNTGADIICSETLEDLANLKMNLADVDEKLSAKHFYGKVMNQSERDENINAVRFTSIPPEVDAYFQAFRKNFVNE